MIEKIRKMKNEKGFTLVELIVVLVILAILAALLIPALTGYIDKANKEKVIAETRTVTMAAQTIVSETYGKGELKKADGSVNVDYKDIEKLAEADGKDWSFKVYVSSEDADTVGQVKAVELWDGTYGCLYVDGAYYVASDADDIPGTVKDAAVPKASFTSSVVWATAGTTTPSTPGAGE